MTWFRTRYIMTHKLKLAIYFWAFALFVWLIFHFGEYFSAVFGSPEAVRAWARGYGAYAWLAFFVLQIAQVLIAPLNDFVINLAGGFLFGPWLGFTLNYTGWIIGACAVFVLSRKLGVPFVRAFISEKKIDQYDRIIARGRSVIFVLFLLPGPPDDILVYLAGLSQSITFRTFLWMILISKIPGKLVTSFMGSDASRLDMSPFSVFLYALFAGFTLILIIRYKSELRGLLPWKGSRDLSK